MTSSSQVAHCRLCPDRALAAFPLSSKVPTDSMSPTTTNIPTRSFIEPTQACARSSSKHRPFDEPSRRGKHLAGLPDKARGIVGFDHQAKHAKATHSSWTRRNGVSHCRQVKQSP